MRCLADTESALHLGQVLAAIMDDLLAGNFLWNSGNSIPPTGSTEARPLRSSLRR
jgi:hypothetical protein